jgi:hypothetical protein
MAESKVLGLEGMCTQYHELVAQLECIDILAEIMKGQILANDLATYQHLCVAYWAESLSGGATPESRWLYSALLCRLRSLCCVHSDLHKKGSDE